MEAGNFGLKLVTLEKKGKFHNVFFWNFRNFRKSFFFLITFRKVSAVEFLVR